MMLNVTADYPVVRHDYLRGLLNAAAGEKKTGRLIPSFAATAKKKGFDDIAESTRFRWLKSA